jgi:D-serine deaminase-like pyridoxal phosphate-dependent protein
LPAVVAGGSPTFPIHARRPGIKLSPGTPLLWDAGYSAAYPDLEFLVAAVLVGRVVSKPAPGMLCLDLGTKAVASEMPQPRISLLNVHDYRIVGHNEEHLIIESQDAGLYRVGDVVYGVPIHICPTVARFETASVIEGGRCTGEWQIAARNRRISI